nr:hypothetical protein [Rubrobacter tropicus]
MAEEAEDLLVELAAVVELDGGMRTPSSKIERASMGMEPAVDPPTSIRLPHCRAYPM